MSLAASPSPADAPPERLAAAPEPTRRGGRPDPLSVGVRLRTPGRLLLAGASVALAAAVVRGAPALAAWSAVVLAILSVARLALANRLAQAADLRFTLALPAGPIGRRGRPLPVRLGVTRRREGPPLPCVLALRCSGGPAGRGPRSIVAPGQSEAHLTLSLAFPSVGHWRVLGVELSLRDPFGLFDAWGYAPGEHGLTVHPSPRPRAPRGPRPRGAQRTQPGRHPAGHEGDGVELRELRDYVPGDPLRAIAWHATARRRTPVVSAREAETRRRVQLLIDMGPMARAGQPGQAPLDAAIDACADALHTLRHDRVGLTSFDHRVYGHLKPGAGPGHRRRLLAHLLDLTHVIDADLTAITRGELTWRVARFLQVQDGVALTQSGRLSRTARRSLVDPLGEQFDAGHVFAAVTRHLAQDRSRGHAALHGKARPADDLLEARLRVFCALRGLTLPYRLSGPVDAQEQGIHAAVLAALGPGGPDEVWIYSDLRGVSADGPARRALALASARKRRIRVLTSAPLSPPAQAALRGLGAQVSRLAP